MCLRRHRKGKIFERKRESGSRLPRPSPSPSSSSSLLTRWKANKDVAAHTFLPTCCITTIFPFIVPTLSCVSLIFVSHISFFMSFFHCSLFLKLSFCLCVYPQLIQLQSYTSQRTLYCTMTSELLYNWDLKLSLVWTFIALRFFYFRMTLWYSIHQSLSLSTSLF